MKILVTVADSGLGKFLTKHLNAKSFTRKTILKKSPLKKPMIALFIQHLNEAQNSITLHSITI
jgi:hypothetical protein